MAEPQFANLGQFSTAAPRLPTAHGPIRGKRPAGPWTSHGRWVMFTFCSIRSSGIRSSTAIVRRAPMTRRRGGEMKIFMKEAVFVVSRLCGGATALAQRPTKAELDELVERYQPRLPSVTAEGIESVWLDRLKDEPWYRKLHGEWVARKDDPHILQK